MNTAFTLKVLPVVVGASLALISGDPVQAFTFTEGENGTGEAGGLLSSAVSVNTRPDQPLLDRIDGRLGSRADLYQVYLDGTTFLATTATGGGSYPNTQLFLFDTNGVGLYANDDTPLNDSRYDPSTTNRSTIRLSNPPPAGNYYIAVSSFDWDPIDSSGNYLFPNAPRRAQFDPGNSSRTSLADWRERTTNNRDVFGSYTIILKGVRYTNVSDSSPNPIPSPTPAPNPIPSPTPAPNPIPSPTPVPPSPTPNPSPVPSPTPSPTPTPSPIPSPTPSPSPIPSPTPSPIPSPTPSPIPSPTPPLPIDPTPPQSVPEASSVVSLLVLGALGMSSILRRRS